MNTFKDVVHQVCMAITVTYVVPTTVKIAHVTFRMEPVLHASRDGPGNSAIEELFFLYDISKSVSNMHLVL